MIKFRQQGDHAVHRGVYNGKVWIARPVIVVEDRPDETQLLIVPGSICKFTTGLKTRKYRDSRSGSILDRWDEQLSMSWELYDHTWFGKRVLIINRPGDWYAIQLHWEHDTDTFLGWYVNFELPLVRSTAGYDTLDLELDLIIHPDYSLEWKDLEEYENGVERGVISAEQVAQIEQGKVKVLNDIQQKSGVFADQKLKFWKPPVKSTVPQLYESWNEV